jgi:hypothetical protein
VVFPGGFCIKYGCVELYYKTTCWKNYFITLKTNFMIKQFIVGTKEPIDIVKSMIRANIIRLRALGGITDLSKETLAVKLDGKDLRDFLKSIDDGGLGAEDLVAFFGVDNASDTSTIIIMGLKDGKLIKKDDAYLAVERWTRHSSKVQDIINDPTKLDTVVFP